ncbi:MAG: hypothetical protein L7F77_02985 [Candidatus Magnetominusculus sp. LBB02]|nr:hypothetical protein [Candidatus Magnetominusculus sp. LBB02]
MLSLSSIPKRLRAAAGVMLAMLMLLAASAEAGNMVVNASIDGYSVTMVVFADNLPSLGANPVVFELRDSSGKEVPDIADVGVTYSVAGFMPRAVMPLSVAGSTYKGVLNITKAAVWDCFFVFEKRGEKQRSVRFTFQTRDAAPSGR